MRRETDKTTIRVKRKLKSIMRVAALFTFSFSLFTLSSCSEDDLGGEPGKGNNGNGGDIRFEIGFAGQTSAGGPQTRAATLSDFTSAWENNDEIGIFACTAGTTLATSGNHIHNVKLTYNKTANTWTPSEALWWPGSGGKLDFYAYYPYDAGATDPTDIAFNVATDQGAAADHNKSDLLTAKTANKGKADGAITLSFNHALAMVQVSIPGGKGWMGGSEGLTVTLRDVKPAATLNLKNINGTPGSEVTPAASGNDPVDITMYRMEQPDASGNYLYRALVPAQTIAQNNSLFLFDHEGRMLLRDGALASAVNMTAGTAEKFTRTMPATMIETVFIPKGTFLMGSSDGSNIGDNDNSGLNTTPAEPNRDSSREAQHKVTLTKDFRMSKYPVTFAQYDAFCDATSHSKPSDSGWGRGNRPVVNVTWNDAVAYCAWLSAQTGQTWKLPTEAQWEYACRGGKANKPYGIGNGDNLTTGMANYNWSVNSTTEVGHYPYTNSYGLYDMHGNVWEWCLDSWNGNNYSSTPAIDPESPNAGSGRVLRGGSWRYNAQGASGSTPLCC